VFLGYLCKRMQLIRPELGEMKGMGFFIGRIAFPLLVFKTIAKADFGAVDPMTILSCFLGKVTVWVLMWGIGFYAYQSSRSFGQKWLTATIFSYFVVSSDDFAVGFPVISAVYAGQNMVVYIAANALVSQAVLTPLATAMLAIGANLSQPAAERTASGDSAPPPNKCMSILVVIREILLSPVVLMTLFGFFFKFALGFLLVKDAEGGIQFVSPLEDLVTLITSPFSECALFLSGSSLQTPRLQFWPILLVAMKVVFCAFSSYAFANMLVQSPPLTEVAMARNIDFTFFYGMIPTSSAPLLFARQFDPNAADMIATAQLFGLVLAGPLLFLAAIFLQDPGDLTSILVPVELETAAVSLVSGIIIIIMLLILRAKWGYADPQKFIIAALVVVLMALEAITLFMNPDISPEPCRAYNMDPRTSLYGILLSALQNACRLLVLVLMAMPFIGPRFMKEGLSVKHGALLLAVPLGISLVIGWFVVPQAITEMCSTVEMPDRAVEISLIPNLVVSALFLTAFAIMSVFSICKGSSNTPPPDSSEEPSSTKDGDMEASRTSDSAATDEQFPDEYVESWLATSPNSVLKGMAFVQVATVFLQLVNTYAVMSGETAKGSFALMLVMETMLQHGQLVILLGLLVANMAYCRHFMTVMHERLPWMFWRTQQEEEELSVNARATMASQGHYLGIQRLATAADMYSMHPDEVGRRVSMIARRRTTMRSKNSSGSALSANRADHRSSNHTDIEC